MGRHKKNVKITYFDQQLLITAVTDLATFKGKHELLRKLITYFPQSYDEAFEKIEQFIVNELTFCKGMIELKTNELNQLLLKLNLKKEL